MAPTASAGPSPDPLQVTVQLAPDVTTTSLVTTDQGGYLSLFAPDGTMYALTIPPGAVLSDLDMTMTLVTSVAGSPLGDELVGAVDIGPSGLAMLQPAMLTITPQEPLPVTQEGPFTSRSDGADFHMTPLVSDPATLTIPILHTTVFGVVRSDQQRRADTLRTTAASVEAQLSQEIAVELQKAREKALAGDDDWDPAPVFERLQAYRDTVLVPMMAAAETDHTLLAETLRRWLAWERGRQLIGDGDGALDPEILESFKRAFEHYVAQTKERCYAHDFGVVIDWLRVVKTDVLLKGVLGLADADAAAFLHDCLTFTLEMDSRATADVNPCILFDGVAKSDLRLQASVVMHYDDPGPWIGPMRWVTGMYRVECHSGEGIVELNATVEATGFADPKELTVLAWKPELNVIAQGEETTAVLRLQHVIVQPGDPELSFRTTGDASVLPLGVTSKDGSTSTGSAGWRDTFRASAGGTPVDATLDGAIILADWVPTGDGDELARREHKETSTTTFGTTSNDTTFTLRHTPVR